MSKVDPEIGVSGSVPPGSTEARESTQGTANDRTETTMTKRIREQRREQFLALLTTYELTRAGAADLLHVSGDTVNAWLKPETSKSSNPVPLWAIELLEFKMKAKRT